MFKDVSDIAASQASQRMSRVSKIIGIASPTTSRILPTAFPKTISSQPSTILPSDAISFDSIRSACDLSQYLLSTFPVRWTKQTNEYKRTLEETRFCHLLWYQSCNIYIVDKNVKMETSKSMQTGKKAAQSHIERAQFSITSVGFFPPFLSFQSSNGQVLFAYEQRLKILALRCYMS